MKRVTNSLAGLALIIVSSSTFAAGGNYFNAQYAIAQIDAFNDGSALVATYGMPMPNVHKNFSVEGELNMTLSDAETTLVGVPITADYYSVGGYAVYTVPVNDKFKFIGRAGFVYINLEATSGNPSVVIVSTDDGLKFSFGLGLSYNINKKMNFIAGYTSLSSDVSQLSAGVQYMF